jgi:hypothetical protein
MVRAARRTMLNNSASILGQIDASTIQDIGCAADRSCFSSVANC